MLHKNVFILHGLCDGQLLLCTGLLILNFHVVVGMIQLESATNCSKLNYIPTCTVWSLVQLIKITSLPQTTLLGTVNIIKKNIIKDPDGQITYKNCKEFSGSP